MNHSHFRELLHLSVYGELTPDERQILEGHLPECADCRAELAELNKMSAMLSERKLIEPDETLLREARRELRVALRLELSRRSVWQKIADLAPQSIQPRYRVAFGGVAMLGIGLLAGYMIFSKPPGSDLDVLVSQSENTAEFSEVGDARIANVRFIDPDASDGEVEFVFEAVKPVRMKGSVNDKQIQRVLTHALLNEQNPGVRLRTVNTIASQVALTQSVPNEQVQDVELVEALIEALKFDPNDGVRKEALKVLIQFPLTKAIRDALLYALVHDKNPGIRVEAIKNMEKAKAANQMIDEQTLNVLRQKMEQDDNNYIRLRARAILQEVKQQ
jgi:hypothetical protein